MRSGRMRAAFGALLSVTLLAACSTGSDTTPSAGPSLPGTSTSAPGGSATAGATPSAGATASPGSPSPTRSPSAPSPGATPAPSAGATAGPGTAPSAAPVVVDVLGSLRDSGSTSDDGGVGTATAKTARTMGSRAGFFGDARAGVDAGAAGESYAYARGATRASLTVPRSGTYEYDWRARYHVEGRSTGGPDDDASVRVMSWVDPGVFSDRGRETAADLTLTPGTDLPIDGTLARKGRVTVTAGQRVDIRLESSCTVFSGGIAKASTCRSWVGFDRFVLRRVSG